MTKVLAFAVTALMGTLFCAALIGVYADGFPKPKAQWIISFIGGILLAAYISWLRRRWGIPPTIDVPV